MWIGFKKVRMRKIYCTKCKKRKIPCICDKALLLSSICKKCGSKYEKIFKEEESIEILEFFV